MTLNGTLRGWQVGIQNYVLTNEHSFFANCYEGSDGRISDNMFEFCFFQIDFLTTEYLVLLTPR